MPKHIVVMSGDQVLLDARIEHCRECPCYNDGAGGEYGESCQIGDGSEDMPDGMFDEGISRQCPLKDVD